MRQLIALFWLAALCSGIAAAEDVPFRGRGRGRRSGSSRNPSGRRPAPISIPPTSPANRPTAASGWRTLRIIEPMPRLIGPGACGGGDMVRLDAVQRAGHVRVELRPAPVLRCAMAESLAAWIHDEAVPRLGKAGMALRAVETYDDFECRGRNRVNGAKLSEHGKGNAVDVRAFTLADNRVIGLTDMAVPKDLRESIRESACARFTTVLGPGSDGHHEGHIHLDIAERRQGYRICQWDVREPPPPAELASAQVPLPTPRPAIADAPIKDGRKL